MECAADDKEWQAHLASFASDKLHGATFSQQRLQRKNKFSKELSVAALGSKEAVFEEIKNFYHQELHSMFTEKDNMRSAAIMRPTYNPKTLPFSHTPRMSTITWFSMITSVLGIRLVTFSAYVSCW